MAVLVSRLAQPSPLPNEVALWAIASCDALSRTPSFPHKITTKSLRETFEAVRDAAEMTNRFIGFLAAKRPLDIKERSTVELLCDSAGRKHPLVLGMSLRLQPGGGLVRVGPSPVHGLGVFAAKAIPKHMIFTSYPIDLLVLRVADHSERRPSDPCVVLSREHANHEVDAHKRLREQHSDYALEMAEDVTVYARPATHTPSACGHLIINRRECPSAIACLARPRAHSLS